jgi:hypothetical protein
LTTHHEHLPAIQVTHDSFRVLRGAEGLNSTEPPEQAGALQSSTPSRQPAGSRRPNIVRRGAA